MPVEPDMSNSPLDCCISVFESHHQIKIKDTRLGILYFYGVDNGIRTHDLQSHNLTR